MSVYTLEFSRNCPLRTTLVDQTTGHPVYQIDTPRRITESVTRIRKFTQPHPVGDEKAGSDSSDEDPTDKREEGGFWQKLIGEELPETDDEIARIHWKSLSSDTINFLGNATTKNKFLPEAGKLGRSFKFTGPGGVEYRWALGVTGMKIPRPVTLDENKTVIAQFHRALHFPKKQRARLEVQPEGMNMLDYIILTFVFVEDEHREREKRAWSGNGH